MAEVIKYGVIWDEELFFFFFSAERLDDLSYLSEELLQTIITRSCQAKADVVSKDEKEAGLRAILNYGHTIGHAIESLTNYTTFVHGEAVAIGMVAAGKIAVEMQMWTQAEAKRQDDLIQKVGLPTDIPAELDVERILETLKNDKKVKEGKVRFILPNQIGKVTMTDQVSADIIRRVLIQ